MSTETPSVIRDHSSLTFLAALRSTPGLASGFYSKAIKLEKQNYRESVVGIGKTEFLLC